jgi:hypothetical protein
MLSASSAFAAHGQSTMFRIRIENISQGNVLKLSSGGVASFALSPGVWLVHTGSAHVFKTGERDWGEGLEAQAEDGNPTMLAESLKKHSNVKSVDIFNTPVGANGPEPILPGGAYELELSAMPGTRLTIVAMFGQSNDLFYAPKEAGIALFDKKRKPSKGDITRHFVLWDAGTEVNQEPGASPCPMVVCVRPGSVAADSAGVIRYPSLFSSANCPLGVCDFPHLFAHSYVEDMWRLR